MGGRGPRRRSRSSGSRDIDDALAIGFGQRINVCCRNRNLHPRAFGDAPELVTGFARPRAIAYDLLRSLIQFEIGVLTGCVQRCLQFGNALTGFRQISLELIALSLELIALNLSRMAATAFSEQLGMLRL